MKRILIIDAWNVLIAQNAVAHIEDGNSQPIGMYLTSLNLLRGWIDKFKPTKVFMVFDGPEAGERRRQLFENYKNKRRITGRESKVTIMEGDENMTYGVEGAWQNQLIQIFEFLKLLPVTVCIIPYNEADDVITYIALKNKNQYENIIISNDKDYLQLIQPGISVYRWKTKILYDDTKFTEEFKILPCNYIIRKILLGDVSDGIEGLKGIGKKTFEKFYTVLSENEFGHDINTFISFLKSMDLTHCNNRERNAILKIMNEEAGAKIKLSYSLMKLDESCMLPEQVDVLKLQIDEQKRKGIMKMSAKHKMQRTSFHKLYNGFNEEQWLRPFVFLPVGIDILI